MTHEPIDRAMKRAGYEPTDQPLTPASIERLNGDGVWRIQIGTMVWVIDAEAGDAIAAAARTEAEAALLELRSAARAFRGNKPYREDDPTEQPLLDALLRADRLLAPTEPLTAMANTEAVNNPTTATATPAEPHE